MNRRLFAFAALACSLPLAAPALADVKAGVDAWAAGDYEGAVKEWREPALAGDADAQFNLGQAYRLGRGVPANLDIALDWFRKAAAPRDGGIIHQKAADEYGLTLFQTGKRAEALPYIHAAAQRGEPRAQYVLGTALFNGQLVGKDWVRGYALMSRAASAGIPAAQRSLDQMDNYISDVQKTQALALASSMGSGDGGEGFQITKAEPAPAARPVDLPPSQPAAVSTARAVDLPPSQPAGATYAPPSDMAETPAPAMAEAPRPAPVPAPAAPASAAAPSSGDFARIDDVSDIPGYVPSAPLRATTDATVSAAPAPRAAKPAPVASGDWRVQIGAFSTEARVRKQFATLEKKVSALSGKQPYLVDAGRITRLQAGPFATKAEAERMCAAVKRAGSGCFSLEK